jgi:DNA mismatch endonuclease (patch repair protein)
MRGNRGKDTTPEIGLRSALHRRGLRFRKHFRPLENVRCVADIAFPRRRLAVFVDGCFWHRCPIHGVSPTSNSAYWQAKLDRNVQRDRRNDALLAAAGWTVLRVWEHEDLEAAADRVLTALYSARSGASEAQRSTQ